MFKNDIESILVINNYFTKMKIENSCCEKSEIVRKYLTKKINKTLNCKKSFSTKVKVLFIFILNLRVFTF